MKKTVNVFLPSTSERDVRLIKRLLVSLVNIGVHTMSVISEFAVKQESYNARVATAIDGIVADIAGLNALIVALQTSAGTVTPEDQATLDALQAAGEAAAAKAEAADAMTPPVVPTA